MQQLSGGAWAPPRGRAILGVQAGAELCQGLADGVGLFLELRLMGVTQSPEPPLPANPPNSYTPTSSTRSAAGPTPPALLPGRAVQLRALPTGTLLH